MAFLCPSRLGRIKHRKDFLEPTMGRMTGSDSLDTLYKLELGRRNADNPETRRIILHTFSGGAPEELAVKQGQKVNILYRECDWAYVIADDKKKGYVPFSFCAKMGTPPAHRAPVAYAGTEIILNGRGTDSKKLIKREPKETTEFDESFTSDFVSQPCVSSILSDCTTFSNETASLDPNNRDKKATSTVRGTTLSTPYQNMPQFQEIFQYLNEQSAKETTSKHSADISNGSTKSDKHNTYDNDDEIEAYSAIIKPPPGYDDDDLPNQTDADKSANNSSKTDICGDTTDMDKHPRNPDAQTKTEANSVKAAKITPTLRKFVQFDPEAPQVIPEASTFIKQSHGRYIVLYDFAAMEENDVAAEATEIVTVLNKDDSDWFWVLKGDASEGFLPSNFMFKLGLIETTGDLNVHKPVSPSVFNSGTTAVPDTAANPTREPKHSGTKSVSRCLSDSIQIQRRDGFLQQVSIHNHHQRSKNRNCVDHHSQMPIQYWSYESVHSPARQDPQYMKPLTMNRQNNTHPLSEVHTTNSTGIQTSSKLHSQSEHVLDKGNRKQTGLGIKADNDASHQQLQNDRRAMSPDTSRRRNLIHTKPERPKSTPPSRNYTDRDIFETSYSHTEKQSQNTNQPINMINVSKIIESRLTNTISHKLPPKSGKESGISHNSNAVPHRNTGNDTKLFESQEHVNGPNKMPETSIHVEDIQNQSIKMHTVHMSETGNQTPRVTGEEIESLNNNTCTKANQKTTVTWQNLAKVVNEKPQSRDGAPNGRETQSNNTICSDKTTRAVKKDSNNFRNSLCNLQSSESIKQIYTNTQPTGLLNGNVPFLNNINASVNQTCKEIYNPNCEQLSSLQSKGQFNGMHPGMRREQQHKGVHTNTVQAEHQNTTASISGQMATCNTKNPHTTAAPLSQQLNKSLLGSQEHSSKSNNQDANNKYNKINYSQPQNSNMSTLKPNMTQFDTEDFINLEEFVSQFEYKARSAQEISIKASDKVYIDPNDQSNDYWYWAYSPKQKKYGYIPKTHVEMPEITII